eukprot:1770535-Amphidinium_carterae.1
MGKRAQGLIKGLATAPVQCQRLANSFGQLWHGVFDVCGLAFTALTTTRVKLAKLRRKPFTPCKTSHCL